jgi:hypothetical protein
MLKISKKILITTLFLLCFFGLAQKSLAVDVFLFSANKEMSSDQFVVSFGLDTGSDKINAIFGELTYDQDILELVSTSNANSIISLWVEAPTTQNNGIVSFSGIVPGGFGGQGKIISLIFKSKTGDKEISKFVKIKEIEVLRNDGTGQAVTTKIISASQNIIDVLDVSSALDTNAPELFKPLLSKNNPLLGDQSYLIFNTTDKGSGVAKYFVAESKTELKIKDKKTVEEGVVWVEATSPYLLTDQSLSSYVYVKVVDRSGNVLVAELERGEKFYQFWWFWVIIIMALSSVILWWKRRKKSF